ncbi:MAG: hypothetical protein DWQ02_24280 [Bacteroidetes bacterium]|nr:MAG: hypothetical protein DWQ02_24280 [Bacteroidota bacterium]
MKYFLLIVACLGLMGCSSFKKDTSVIYLIGDSTMAEKTPEKRPETGWGEKLPLFFEASVKIDNRAKNGRSSKSFLYEGRWDEVIKVLKKGDFVFIQFGHNDSSKKKGERYSTPQEFADNLTRYVQDSRNLGAYPVLLTPVMRRRFDDSGKFHDTHGIYPDITRNIAKELNVPLIDMHLESQQVIEAAGVEDSKDIFLWIEKGENSNYPEGVSDNTHFSEKGATIMAGIVVEKIKALNLTITKNLRKP